MQITRAADYALRAAIHLAAQPPGSRISRGLLASAVDAPQEVLGKVLQELVKARLVVSHRGAAGGFRLARDGASITVLDIVEAIDGTISLNECLVDGQPCPRSSWCAGHPLWLRAQEAMVAVLRESNIARLAEESARNRERRGGVESGIEL